MTEENRKMEEKKGRQRQEEVLGREHRASKF